MSRNRPVLTAEPLKGDALLAISEGHDVDCRQSDENHHEYLTGDEGSR